MSVVPTTVPDGAVFVAHVSRSASQACTFVPMASPRLARALAAVVAFVPPFAIGKAPVTPVVMGRPVQLVSTPADGVPRAGVVKLGDTKSAFVATAIAMLANSVLISVPLTILSGSPDDNASLVAKLVLFHVC